MTAARVAHLAPNELVALLEADGASLGVADGDRTLSPWLEQALHGPVREFLARPGKEFRARLCELSFALAGGRAGALPPELPLVIEALHAGSLIVDDIEDDSDERRGAPALHRLFGMPVALNAGNWLYFWAQRLVVRSNLHAELRLRAHERMAHCLMRCHEGQALDLTLRVERLPRASVAGVVRGLSERKTGALMGLAAAFGGLSAGAPDTLVDALERFGCDIGTGLQMLDDLSGITNASREDKGREDLMHGRATWVWAWLADDLEHAQYVRLVESLQDAQVDGAVEGLLDELRFRLAVIGPRHAKRHLEQAVSALADAVGDGPWRAKVEEDLRWLSQRFLGADR